MSSGIMPDCHVAPERCAFNYPSVDLLSLEQKIAANIKAAREARGLTYVELAARCVPPVSYQMISRLEKGERGITPDWIERIAAAMGMEPMDLLVGNRGTPEFRLSEQVANEVARVLGRVALEGQEPPSGTVQVLALMLQELTVTFARHPGAMRNPDVVRPVTDSLTRQLARASN